MGSDSEAEKSAKVKKVTSLAPIAKALAGKKLCKKTFKLVRRASEHKCLKRGVQEVVKSIRRGNKGHSTMLKVKTPKSQRARRALEKRAPKLVENVKKTLILQGVKSSDVLNKVLAQIHHLKRESSIRYTKKNDKILPFESGGESSLEFFSLKTDCSLFVLLTLLLHLLPQYGSHSKKRPNNLVLGRTYDHHIYDLIEVGIENFKPMESFSYDRKAAPKNGSKPLFAFIGEGFESAEELKHLKEVLLDLFRGEVIENLNLTGVDRVYVCTAVSLNTVLFMQCAIRLKRSGSTVPRVELVEVGPSMDLVVRRHRLPNDGVRKEAMKSAPKEARKVKNVVRDAVQGKLGKIYIPDQKVGTMPLSNDAKGLKRERREAKVKRAGKESHVKKQKLDSEA